MGGLTIRHSVPVGGKGSWQVLDCAEESQAEAFLLERNRQWGPSFYTKRAETGSRHLSTQKSITVFNGHQLILSWNTIACLHTSLLLRKLFCCFHTSGLMGEAVFCRHKAAIAKGTSAALLQPRPWTLTWDLLSRLLPRLVGTAPTLRHERLRTTAGDKKACWSRQ